MRHTVLRVVAFLMGMAIIVGMVVFIAQLGLDQADKLASVFGAFFGVVALSVAAYALVIGLLRQRQDIHHAERARQALQRAETSLSEADQLALPALWDVTHKRLDYYHQIATSQARQSFRNAQLAMGVGFVLLVVFAVLAFNASTTTASIVTGTLGAASAAFAGYISRTFVRSQESAANHLRAYFDQPLEFSRYLAAERLLDALDKLHPEQRATISGDLLRAIVSPGSTSHSAPAEANEKDGI